MIKLSFSAQNLNFIGQLKERKMRNKDQERISLETARILLNIGAINFNISTPYKLASGLLSPTYVDCRKIISEPKSRSKVIDFFQEIFLKELKNEKIQNIAGGETAGIPFAALLADRLNLPLCYVRKKPKGYGKNSQIEGRIKQNQNILLVEDLATDGGSKINFVNALRKGSAKCNNVFVLFYYNIFDSTRKLLSDNSINLYYLTTWHDILSYAKKENLFDIKTLTEVDNFLSNPTLWSEQRS